MCLFIHSCFIVLVVKQKNDTIEVYQEMPSSNVVKYWGVFAVYGLFYFCRFIVRSSQSLTVYTGCSRIYDPISKFYKKQASKDSTKT